MSLPASIDEFIAATVNPPSMEETLGLQFGGLRIDVRSNSAALVGKLSAYYRDFLDGLSPALIEVETLQQAPLIVELPLTRKDPEPGKRRVKEEYVDLPDGRIVRKVLTGMVFVFGGRRNLAVGPCMENDNQVVNFINNRHIEWLINRGALLFHAAGVAHRQKGLALAGFSGMGKSTLALQIMRHGTDFVSNDRVLVEQADGRLQMHGVAKMPRVNPGTVLHNDRLQPVMSAAERAEFSALPSDELWNLEHKYDAFIDTCFGSGKFRLTSDMAGLVILNWERNSKDCTMRPVELTQRRDLLPAFMKSVGLFFEMDDPAKSLDFSEEAYLQLLEGCPVFEITGGTDFESAARQCMDFLEGNEGVS
jgi:HprK-related kinase B